MMRVGKRSGGWSEPAPDRPRRCQATPATDLSAPSRTDSLAGHGVLLRDSSAAVASWRRPDCRRKHSRSPRVWDMSDRRLRCAGPPEQYEFEPERNRPTNRPPVVQVGTALVARKPIDMHIYAQITKVA
jgi:hypothetical protein